MRRRIYSGRNVATALLVVLIAELANGQNFSDWSAPVNLGPFINFAQNNQHPAISSDGLSLYYSAGPTGFLDIWVSHRASLEDEWGPPQKLGPNVNSAFSDLSPTFTPDGHWMYFMSNRPNPCSDPANPTLNLDLYVTHRQDKRDDVGWEPAQDLGCVINGPYDDAGPTYFDDEDHDATFLYFTSTRPGPPGCSCGNFDIYVSTLQMDGTWGPGQFVQELSGPGRDTRTAISKDGLEMFISADRPGGVGSQDIWVSTRNTTADKWSTPVDLGPMINSTAFDGAPALSRDGTTLYFFSERTDVTHYGLRDLYVSTRTKLPD